MRKTALIIALLALNLSFSFAQTATDSILIKKAGREYQFYQGGERLNMRQLLVIMHSNEMAFKQMRSAQSSYTLGLFVGMTGGFMVGYPLGTALAGGEPNWTIAIIGGALIVAYIPISQGFNKKSHQAVETYNAGLQTTSFWDTHELNLSITTNGLGIALNF